MGVKSIGGNAVSVGTSPSPTSWTSRCSPRQWAGTRFPSTPRVGRRTSGMFEDSSIQQCRSLLLDWRCRGEGRGEGGEED